MSRFKTSPTAHALTTLAFATATATATALHSPARADSITDWNQRSAQFVADARLGTPPAVRVMALVQTAGFEAARDASRSDDKRAIDAAVAGAHRTVFLQLLPTQRAAVEAAFAQAVAHIADEATRQRLVAVGEQAAQRVLAARAGDLPTTPETYRPHTSAGAYVPTTAPAVPMWSQRKPWLLDRADQVRPAPPPTLTSERWAREYNEAKALGGRDSKERSAEQTDIARFWDYSLPAVYHGVLRSVALQPGREVLANARLFASAAQAMDDALIAVFDAKYHYNFWRPGTAIRNGDIDGHDTTAREPGWVALIDVPMHPEYPSGHSILACTVRSVLKAELGAAPTPVLATSSPTANNTTRRWTSLDAFVREVSDARVWAGVHFRSATEAGEAMGERIGKLAAERAQGLARQTALEAPQRQAALEAPQRQTAMEAAPR
jgi:hypothetical protein